MGMKPFDHAARGKALDPLIDRRRRKPDALAELGKRETVILLQESQ
jgi:hypothetical protein